MILLQNEVWSEFWSRVGDALTRGTLFRFFFFNNQALTFYLCRLCVSLTGSLTNLRCAFENYFFI